MTGTAMDDTDSKRNSSDVKKQLQLRRQGQDLAKALEEYDQAFNTDFRR